MPPLHQNYDVQRKHRGRCNPDEAAAEIDFVGLARLTAVLLLCSSVLLPYLGAEQLHGRSVTIAGNEVPEQQAWDDSHPLYTRVRVIFEAREGIGRDSVGL